MDLDLGMTEEQIFSEIDKYKQRIDRKPLLVVKIPYGTESHIADSIIRAARSLKTVFGDAYHVIMVPSNIDIAAEETDVVNLTFDGTTDSAKLILELEKYAVNRKKENK